MRLASVTIQWRSLRTVAIGRTEVVSSEMVPRRRIALWAEAALTVAGS
jgi:hypothetical protein